MTPKRISWTELSAHPWTGYIVAVVATSLTVQLRLVMQPLLDGQTLMVIFSIPIMISAYVGGLGPGLLATALSHVASVYFLLPPAFSFRIASESDHWLQVCITAAGIVISGLSELLHRRRRGGLAEQREAAAELRAAMKENTDLRVALDQHAVVTFADAAGKITFVNDRFCAISGYSRAELLAQDHRIIKSGHHPDAFFRDLWTTIRAGKAWHGEIRNRAKNGSYFWMDTTIVPFLDDTGAPRKYVSIRTDITQQKNADEARQALDARYRALFNCAPDGILIADEQNHLFDANPSACRMLGYTHAELLGQHVSRIVTTAEVAEIIPTTENLRRNAEYKREWQLRRKDGSTLMGEVFSTVLPDGKLLGLVRDVSERKTTDEILKTAAKEVFDLKAALDEHAIVAITDPRGRITYVNDRFCAISKYPRAELIGQDHRIINSGHHPQEFIRDLWTTITEGRVWRGEIKNRAKDGSFYWVETTIVPFLDDHGKPRQYVAIRADITERKRVEEVATRLHAIEQANRLKTEFLANMSHELRTPLNGVIGFSEVILAGKPGPLTPTQRDFLDHILSSGRHLLRLINDVLDLSKVEAGKIELRPERFNVESAINEVCSVSRGIAQKRRIEIRIKIEAPLADVVLDQQKFKQILYNLISNAVKFNHDHGRVDVFARCLGDALQVQVQDRGIGIRATDLPRLFHEFEQLDVGTARRYGGTGLGLALTKKIVEAQGGTIAVESEFNVGSTFTVTLPRNEKT